MKEDNEPIKIYAIYRKNATIEIRDQHGRKFEATSETLAGMLSGESETSVRIEVALEAPRWPTDKPHAEIRIRVPLEVEERLPEWMREYLAERI